MSFEARPLTPGTWSDLEHLFAQPGGSIVRGCWCMFYRKSGQAASSENGPNNKRQFRDLVGTGTVPGLIGYLDAEAVGWISLGPRQEYEKLSRSPIMKPVDDADVWSIICAYVARSQRGKGLQHKLLSAAISYARQQGVRLLEAYPVDKLERSHDDFMFFGSKELYARAGFKEVVRRSPTRVIMRRTLRPGPTARSGKGSSS